MHLCEHKAGRAAGALCVAADEKTGADLEAVNGDIVRVLRRGKCG